MRDTLLGDGNDSVTTNVRSDNGNSYPATLDGQAFRGGSGVDTFSAYLSYYPPTLSRFNATGFEVWSVGGVNLVDFNFTDVINSTITFSSIGYASGGINAQGVTAGRIIVNASGFNLEIPQGTVYGTENSDEYRDTTSNPLASSADVFQGNGGNDYFDGADGIDIAIYSGNSTDYTLTEITYNQFQVKDNRNESPDGIDIIVDVNRLRFANGDQDVVIAGLNIVGDDSSEDIDGGSNADYIDGAGGNDTVNGEGGNDDLAGGSGNDSINGGQGNDFMDGGQGSDNLNGGVGNDNMAGGLGSDTYVVDSASDVVTEDSGTTNGVDLVQASVSYVISDADVEKLTLLGNTAINGTGNGSANTLTGNSAANTLNGGGGNDTMVGGAGNDIYVVDVVGDVITEAASQGTDTVQSSITHTLGANVENLTLTGSAGISGTGNSLNNVLTGNAAVNTLNGGAGNDSIRGGLGKDSLTGSAGIDNFIYESVTESGVGNTFRDVITDFQGAGGEKINLSAIDAYIGIPGNQAFAYIGASSFTGTKGEVRFSGGVLQMNTGTDKIADMEIALTGVTAFQSTFLIL
jgi:Ca2+-binding RTX toxin-like protein